MLKKSEILKYKVDEDGLEIMLYGEIDHHNAVNLRCKADALIIKYKPHTVRLNLEKIDFMDSSGLGFIMGRMSVVEKNGGKLIVKKPSNSVKKICKIVGLERLVTIEK